jgi:hypothetical protein
MHSGQLSVSQETNDVVWCSTVNCMAGIRRFMSAKIWRFGKRTVACVPELGLYSYGISQSEALFRLFTVLLKYYRQLRAFKHRLGHRGLSHLELLSTWIAGMEDCMRLRTQEINLVMVGSDLI